MKLNYWGHQTLKQLENASLDTYQSDELKLTIMQHGIMVNQYFLDLYSHIQFNTPLQYTWVIPEWLYDNKEYILKNLLPIGTLSSYQIYHDIGKPFCKTYDIESKKPHFYNHAEISATVYPGSEEIKELIGSDMLIHTIKAKDIEWFSEREDAMSLLLTGLSEIHANAEMFGGIESTSFKIKYKQINQRGKALLKRLVSWLLKNGEKQIVVTTQH